MELNDEQSCQAQGITSNAESRITALLVDNVCKRQDEMLVLLRGIDAKVSGNSELLARHDEWISGHKEAHRASNIIMTALNAIIAAVISYINAHTNR